MQDAGVDRLDILQGFVSLQSEERLAGLDAIAVLFEPLAEHTFIHAPAKTGDCDFDGHWIGRRRG